MTAEEWKAILVGVPLVVAGFTLLFLLPIAGYRFWERRAKSSLDQILDGLELRPNSDSSAVTIVFHSYYGLLVVTHWIKREYRLPPGDARVLLRRLRNFNFKWGVWGACGAYVPFLTLLEYRKMSRSIDAQVSSAHTPAP